MIVLGIETSTDCSGVSLADEKGTLAELIIGRARRHVETVVPGIETLLRMAGMDMSAIEAVAVDTGPGLFTGLRVGVATAKSLCFALGIKAVAIGSLEVLAYAVSQAIGSGPVDGWTILTVIDAKRGEVFWNTYAVKEDQVLPAGEAQVSSPGELAAAIASGERGRRLLAVGDGTLRYSDELSWLEEVSFGGPALYSPPPGVLAVMGVQRVLAGEYTDANGLSLQYLRAPDAVANWKIRDGLSRIAP
ncbi:MAG: tRNA (adenosine(37)-N6)-threonylcarbamoyltransferase complex dimerization subunit type 1 TsaB [Acidimicrobiales bacterium]